MKSDSPWVMGILNVTPDSFSDGGRFLAPEAALKHALSMIQAGADIIDVGGESTRPGAEPVSLEEERDRVLPVIELLRKETDVFLSVDTTKYELAFEAAGLGVNLVNDVNGGEDIRLVSLLKKFPEVQLVLMHRKGDSKTMQNAPQYPMGVVSEVKEKLIWKVKQFCEAGIEAKRLWLDPGIGFGKTVNHNLDLLRHLDQWVGIAGRVVVGTSRKSFLSAVLQTTSQEMALREPGTLATHLWAYQKGASVFRVHDVGAMKRALITWRAIQHGSF
ncbi:MAG: dihydropteroate synthase [Deltaproteobacteria bacterium]